MEERIERYKDLRVCQNTMKVAMEIFRVLKSFPPEENILLLISYSVLLGLLVQIELKLGVNYDIKQRLSRN